MGSGGTAVEVAAGVVVGGNGGFGGTNFPAPS
jgi:hypothetical protein